MPIKLLYVCNFSNIHARCLVAHFAERLGNWSVTVLSSDPAEPMDNVRLLQLNPARGLRQAVTRGRFARLAYRVMGHVPGVLVRMRKLEFLIQVQRNRRRALSLIEGEKFDVIHALRLQPEGIIADGIKRSRPELPFFLTTWGQDLVLFASRPGRLAAMSRAALARVEILLPDNDRDDRLARERFALRADCRSMVMPATGGIRPDELPDEFPSAEIPGSPSLLSMRGYENAYIRLRVMIRAFARFLETHPNARFYIDVNAVRKNPERDAHVRRWIREAGVEGRAHLVHLYRQGVLAHMAGCDLYVSATVSDGLPMSLVEALWYGQIAVVHRLESLERIARETRGVRFYEHIDEQTIAHAWREAVHEGRDRSARREQNREAILRHYDRSANLVRLGKLYLDAASEPLAAKRAST